MTILWFRYQYATFYWNNNKLESKIDLLAPLLLLKNLLRGSLDYTFTGISQSSLLLKNLLGGSLDYTFTRISQSSLHTYIHNWPLQSFSQDYGLASHTTHAVNVNFIRERRELQFNVDSERQIFENLFHGNFIYSQSFCRNLLRGSRRRNIFQ